MGWLPSVVWLPRFDSSVCGSIRYVFALSFASISGFARFVFIGFMGSISMLFFCFFSLNLWFFWAGFWLVCFLDLVLIWIFSFCIVGAGISFRLIGFGLLSF